MLEGPQSDQVIRCYEDLGVVEDMASTSIIEAFQRQVSVDPTRTPLYLKCLKTIGCLRGGQDGASIESAVQDAYEQGKFTDDDVSTAYEYFGLGRDDPYLTDDTIIGKFHALLKDTAHENESRRQLWRIGEYRQSEQIKSASEDSMYTGLRRYRNEVDLSQEYRLLSRRRFFLVLKTRRLMTSSFPCTPPRYPVLTDVILIAAY